MMGEDEMGAAVDWARIGEALRAPFAPEDVDYRVQGRANEQTGKAQVVAFVDARAVQDRLDAVVGPGNWSFDWHPVSLDGKGEVTLAKGTLTIYGVSKADAGTASTFEASLGAVSHCFKRAAVQFGIGRYLYAVPSAYVAVEKGGRIPDATLRELRGRLPKPDGKATDRAADRAADRRDQHESAGEREPASDAQPAQAPRPARTAAASAASAPTAPTQAPTPLRPAAATPAAAAADSGAAATPEQVRAVGKLCAALGRAVPAHPLTAARARELIASLSGELRKASRTA